MFDATITLGNVFTIGTGIGGLAIFFHKFDKRIDVRHAENKAAMGEVADALREVKNDMVDLTRNVHGVDKRVAILEALSKENQAFNIRQQLRENR